MTTGDSSGLASKNDLTYICTNLANNMASTTLTPINRPIEVISPVKEIVSYEALWTHHNGVKKMADLFRHYNHALPSTIAEQERIPPQELNEIKGSIGALLSWRDFSAIFYRDSEYPSKLRDADHPAELLYYQGALDLLSSKSVAVVGARKASKDGLARARRIAKLLVENGYTVMSGLAEGIDTAAHTTALECGGKTIAVIGTSLNAVYPPANSGLQQVISKEHLLVSQVPFYQYSLQQYYTNRFFFPERNKTMSALSLGTIIVEASETSGTLIQARAALKQGRKLFILDSCFEKGLKWPYDFLTKGAIRVKEPKDILGLLGS
jgi:DNA processing protein